MSEGYLTSEDLSEDSTSDNDYQGDNNVCPRSVLDLINDVKYGTLDDVIRHRNLGTNMEGVDYDQRSALHIAAAEGKQKHVEYLLHECNVNPLVKDRYGRIPYDDAKYFKHEKTAGTLRKRILELYGQKHDPEQQQCAEDMQNITSCIDAAAKGNLDTLKRYHASGMDMSLGDYDRRTPLHLAAAEGQLEVVAFLLKECKVTPTSKDRWESTAIDEARKNKHADIEQLLLDYTEHWIPSEIQSLDPHSIELYVTALREGKDIPNTIRINVVGHAHVGKTTLTRKLLGLQTDTVENTNGVDVHKAVVGEGGQWEKKDGEEETLHGVRRMAKITDLLDIPDVVDGPLFDNDGLNPPSTSSTRGPSPVNFYSSSAETDSSAERRISKDKKAELEAFVPAITNKSHDEEKSKAGKIINIWDFGGQFIFYATHQLFHSPRAVYLLVLDLSRSLDDIVDDKDFPESQGGLGKMDIRSFCKFWLQSIHSFVGTPDGDPPVFLVGTHIDLLPGTKEEKEEQAMAYLKNVRRLFADTTTANHIQERMFIVDNTADSNDEYDSLRRCITNLVQEKQTWNPEMPAKWIPLETSLIKRKPMKYITFEEVCNIDKESVFPIGNEEEIRVFLTYHHAQGTIVYFNDDGLSDFVILDPQWIVDAFKCIITSSTFCHIKSIQTLRRELISEAILRPKLVDEAWGSASDQDFLQQKEILLRYLNRLGIIAIAQHFDVSTHITEKLDFFIVPSLLHRSCSNCWLAFRYENMNNPLAFVFSEDIVSPTVYHHITSALLGRWPVVKRGGRAQLFADSGEYQLDKEHVGIIRITDNAIELNVGNTAGNPVENRLSDHYRRFVEMVLKDSLEKFNVKSDQKYALCVKCDQSLHVKSKRLSFTPNSHMIDIKLIMQQWFPNTLKTISAYRRSKKVTQRELSKLPNAIGCNWELLGISLGVEKTEIDKIKMESPYSTAVQMYHAFNIWFVKEGENATWDVLLREMADHYRVTIDWDIVRNILEDIPVQHSISS